MTSLFSDFVQEHAIHVVQPIVNATTHEVHFYEVLTRVKYKNKLYQPIQFIPDMNIQMKFSLAKKLFYFIGTMQMRYPTLLFSLNISALEIEMGIEDFLNDICMAENFKIDPKRCIIEITEHASIGEPEVYESILRLKERFGFKFALDDFGTKYATLKQVYDKDTGFDYVKVDGSMIHDIETNIDTQFMLNMIVQIIQKYKKLAIVEYISSEEKLRYVSKAKPDFLQGYFFGEPMPIDFYVENKDDIFVNN